MNYNERVEYLSHSVRVIEKLSEAAGSETTRRILKEEAEKILKEDFFSESDIDFLLSQSFLDEADRYLRSHAEEFRREPHSQTLPYCEIMEEHGYTLTALCLYRNLLLSILDEEYREEYESAARYLLKVETLSEQITEWEGEHDEGFFNIIMDEEHGRKSSFWRLYRNISGRS